MKITVAQLNYHIGNFEGNTNKMLKAVAEAKKQGTDIICFSELATCGYPPRDFLEFDDFIRLGEQSIAKLAEAAKGIAIVVGSVSRNAVLEGKDLHNSAYFLADGAVQYVQHKTLLPTYDIFDEYRYFEPASEWNVVEYKGKKIALTVCEDIWNIGNENPLYKICPLDEMMKYKPDFILNVSASPFSYTHADSRREVVKANMERYKIPMIYINHVGAQTEIVFDGGSLIANGNGCIHAELPFFEESIETFALDDILATTEDHLNSKEKIALIHDAIVLGIKDYFGKLGFKKAVLGLSGGIDSAVTMALAARALGPENVHALLMPSQYSSGHSVADAEGLAKNLGSPYDIIPIKGIYDSVMDQMGPIFGDLPFNVTEENIQARSRGLLNMAFSNKFGNILLNTSNKSEMAVGYGTLYGDLCGGLSVIADVYKTEVFALKDPQDIIDAGFDEKLVRRVLRMVNINEFKRYQTAPVLRVSPKAFGMGRRMPIVGKYLS